eukprot:gb/GECH01003198.1/.p1 GENE.gb/GECH01003198.1/~~gb/GECH01003198.1/.p1  ORF type:complete len:270 (+),score=71.40 gb/GECH01003198.1/:1-810(+)
MADIKVLSPEGNDSFNSHRCVISARCPELFNDLKEKLVKKDNHYEYTVEGVDFDVFKDFVKYMYTDKVDVEYKGENSTLTDEKKDAIQQLKVLAEKYKLDRLAKLCEHKLGESVEVPESTLTKDFGRIFNNNEDGTADVTLVVDDVKIPAHRAFLSTRCGYFKGMFESGMEEAQKNEINIPDASPEAFKKLVEYIYTDTVQDMGNHALELFGLANRFTLKHLESLCEESIRESVDESNVEEVLKVAELFDSKSLKQFCEEKMKRFKDNN